jgi:ATP-dependent DNA helicase PIF1
MTHNFANVYGAKPTAEPPPPELDPVQAGIAREIFPRSFLITGPAGTGKSVLAEEVIRRLRKAGRTVYVTASTGIAAINVKGCTIHSWLGTNIVGSVREAQTKNAWEFNERAERRIKFCDVLVIDEISMLSGDYVDLIDWRLRTVCNRDEPFAGKQLLFFGDFLQLPPVFKEGRGPKPEHLYAFQAEAWEKASVQTRELTINHRQGEDAEFSKHLMKIRVGVCDDETRDFMRACVGRRLQKPIMLYPTNAAVDNTNRKKLAQLPGEARQFQAEMCGDEKACAMLARSCLAEQTLRLKPGAQALMIRNVYEGESTPYFTNGERGTVREIRDDEIVVDLETEGQERTVTARRETWEWRNADEKVLATLSQFPIKLGWAVTIHKSQGMTLERMKCNVSRCFAPGQAYVALSRAKNAKHLSIEGTFGRNQVFADKTCVEFYQKAKPRKGARMVKKGSKR